MRNLEPRQSVISLYFSIVSRNFLTVVSLAMLVFLVTIALFGSLITPFDPLETSASQTFQPPSRSHWFGTDHLGRDVFSRVLVATRIDIGTAFAAVTVSLAVGTFIGAVAGFFGGKIDQFIGRFVDTIMAFPLFVLAIGIVAALGNNIYNVIYATTIINLPLYIRFSRGEAKSRCSLDFVNSARAAGNTEIGIVLRHIIPNILPAMMIQASLNMGWAILNVAALSFIGLGIKPPQPEWGIMVSEGASYIISGEWWIFLFPGLALTFAVFCFNLMGDGLRDVIDPRSRI